MTAPANTPNPVATAAELAEKVIGDTYYWSLSHAAPAASNGCGAYSFAIFPAGDVDFPDNLEPVAMRDDDDPFVAVWEALCDVGLISEDLN